MAKSTPRAGLASVAFAACLTLASPWALGQPAVGEKANKYLDEVAERYAVYQVDARVTIEEPFAGTSVTEERHYVRAKSGAPYDLVWYTDDRARIAIGDTIVGVIGAERDSARYSVLTGRQRRWFFASYFGSDLFPENSLRWKKWTRASPSA